MAHIYKEGMAEFRVYGGPLPAWHEKEWREEVRKNWCFIDDIYEWLRERGIIS